MCNEQCSQNTVVQLSLVQFILEQYSAFRVNIPQVYGTKHLYTIVLYLTPLLLPPTWYHSENLQSIDDNIWEAP